MLGNMEHAPKLGEYLEAQLERWGTISRTTGMQVNSTFLLGAAICGLAQKPDSVVLGPLPCLPSWVDQCGLRFGNHQHPGKQATPAEDVVDVERVQAWLEMSGC